MQLPIGAPALIPAVTAWACRAAAMFSGWIGLLLSFHADLPSGPAIVLVAGVIYVLSLLFGRHDGLLRRGASCC